VQERKPHLNPIPHQVKKLKFFKLKTQKKEADNNTSDEDSDLSSAFSDCSIDEDNE
jgi:hypothetical protein